MSLYNCIDLIDEYLARSPNLLDMFLMKGNPGSPDIHKQFLQELKGKLDQRIKENHYDNLDEEIKEIRGFMEKNPFFEQDEVFKYILKDLENIKARFIPSHSQNSTADISKMESDSELKVQEPSVYEKYQKKPYRIANLRQGKQYQLGLSQGECQGFSYAMANPALSPYSNPNIDEVTLNQWIHDRQKNQGNREEDQKVMHAKRITNRRYCPDFEDQAEELYQTALKYQGKDLIVAKLDPDLGAWHACYLKINSSTHEIYYTDPNHGVYQFDNPEDFKSFYVAASEKEKKAIHFRFYSLSVIKHSENGPEQEQKSSTGKIRSLMIGGKYHEDVGRLPQLISTMVYSGLGGGAGIIIGGLIGSVVPVVGTALGMIIGGALGTYLGFGLTQLAARKGLGGLSGVPQLIQDKFYQGIQGAKETLLSVQKGIEDTIEPKEASTAMMLGMMPKQPNPSYGTMKDNPISKAEGKEEMKPEQTPTAPIHGNMDDRSSTSQSDHLISKTEGKEELIEESSSSYYRMGSGSSP